jgi:hypothetical protein
MAGEIFLLGVDLFQVGVSALPFYICGGKRTLELHTFNDVARVSSFYVRMIYSDHWILVHLVKTATKLAPLSLCLL